MNSLLEVRNAYKAFAGIKAVQDVSFEVAKGEVLGLIGPNGSGKSTIVNLISGVYKPDGGEYIFDGHCFANSQTIANRASRGIGRTFQSPKPFANYTVYDNVFTVALQKYNHQEAAGKTLEILNLTQLNVYADLPSSKLSIEKRKWLDLARVLAIEPKMIMLDEVMAGLNPAEMEEGLELIRKINKDGVSILFIEHVMKAVVSICHRVIVLNEGHLIANGEPQEVLQKPEVIEAYIGGGQKRAVY